jgi:uncharacterized OsmC-like protein
MSNNEHIEIFSATAQGSGWPTKVAISDSKWTFQVDEPEEDGGSNSGPNPMHHFVASLVGCQNEQAQVVAEEIGIKADKINFTVDVSLNLSGFMGDSENSEGCFKLVKINAEVSGVNADQAKTLGIKVDARCPILSLLRSAGVVIESTWIAK